MEENEMLRMAEELEQQVRCLQLQLDRFRAAHPERIRSMVEKQIGALRANQFYVDRAAAFDAIQNESGQELLSALAVLVFHWGADDQLVRTCMRLANDTRQDLRVRKLALCAIGKYLKKTGDATSRQFLLQAASRSGDSTEFRESANFALGAESEQIE